MTTFAAILMTCNLALADYQFSPNGIPAGNEEQVHQCVQTCLALNDQPNWALRACVEKCQELDRP
jgi:hypothetical protein